MSVTSDAPLVCSRCGQPLVWVKGSDWKLQHAKDPDRNLDLVLICALRREL